MKFVGFSRRRESPGGGPEAGRALSSVTPDQHPRTARVREHQSIAAIPSVPAESGPRYGRKCMRPTLSGRVLRVALVPCHYRSPPRLGNANQPAWRWAAVHTPQVPRKFQLGAQRTACSAGCRLGLAGRAPLAICERPGQAGLETGQLHTSLSIEGEGLRGLPGLPSSCPPARARPGFAGEVPGISQGPRPGGAQCDWHCDGVQWAMGRGSGSRAWT